MNAFSILMAVITVILIAFIIWYRVDPRQRDESVFPLVVTTIITSFLCFCGIIAQRWNDKHEEYINSNPQFHYEKTNGITGNMEIEKISYDGHTYIKFVEEHHKYMTILHDPDCRCQRNGHDIYLPDRDSCLLKQLPKNDDLKVIKNLLINPELTKLTKITENKTH